MGFGILDCRKMDAVPGTSLMADREDLPEEYRDIPKDQLKHGKGRFRDVILVPQPSDSPNDPLNVCVCPANCYNDPTDSLQWPQW